MREIRQPARLTLLLPLLLLLVWSTSAAQSDENTDREKPKTVSLLPAGGGLLLQGENFRFRLLGYAQAGFTLFDSELDRPDGVGDFWIRRARVDFLMTLYDDYTLFLEIDGSPGGGFSLVEAWMNARVSSGLNVRIGKYIVPFSAEDLRSSRSLETIERYLAINGMFLMPALDTQIGLMLHGNFGPKNRLGYAVGVFNGNGSAARMLSDDNEEKEYVGRLTYKTNDLQLGVSADYSTEEPQTISLVDLGFNRWASEPVAGDRIGFAADAFVKSGDFSLRGEGLFFNFESPGRTDGVDYYGGYIQPALFIDGDANDGVQILARLDVAALNTEQAIDSLSTGLPEGDMMLALLAGANWYPNPNVRFQLNAIAHRFNGPSILRGFSEARWSPMVQSGMQIKF